MKIEIDLQMAGDAATMADLEAMADFLRGRGYDVVAVEGDSATGADGIDDGDWMAALKHAASRAEAIRRSAAALGRRGGASRSAAKTAAARANGAKGGRPRKRPQGPAK